eukprot:748935-Hanusia_phi.AAC.2
MAEALSTSGVNDHRLLEDAVSEDQVLKHFIRRDPKGFLVADARRGCCVCEECAQRLADEIVSGSGLIVLRGAISLDVMPQNLRPLADVTRPADCIASSNGDRQDEAAGGEEWKTRSS